MHLQKIDVEDDLIGLAPVDPVLHVRLQEFMQEHRRSAIFSGTNAEAKSRAAKWLAKEKGIDLYRIDLSAVVSKYIGETEKNLALIFDAIAGKNWILFFDEADALFGKRTQVKDAHDKYANMETSYLLQQLQSHLGFIILAANHHKLLHSAFLKGDYMLFHFPDDGFK